MSKSEPDSNNNTGKSSGIGAVQNGNGPEILFDRATNWKHPHEVLRYGITEAILDGNTTLFEVLPGVGKSRSITVVANGLKMPVTILTNLTDNYEQYKGWGDKDGVEVHKLPTSNLCPTLQGDYTNDPSAQEAEEAYHKSWSVSTIHREFDVPCKRGKNTCPYREKIEEIDSDGPNPLVGHYTQGHNSLYVNNRVVVIDEDAFDSYIREIKNPVEKADEYLDTLDGVPFNSIPYKPDEKKIQRALKMLENEGLDPADHQDSVGEFHAKAPLTAYAILTAEKMENGWWVADLPSDRTATFYEAPRNGSLHLFDPPDLSGADAIIGLDATPAFSKWEAIIGSDFDHYRLFNDDQRNQYLREQGYEFIQLNDYVWPVSAGDVSLGKCEAYIREVDRKHGQRPDVITSRALLGRKDGIEGLEDRNLGHLWSRDMHYGNLRSRNKLGDSELLVILGSPSRKDSDIQVPAALLGECAIAAENENGDRLTGYDLNYQSEVANDILETARRDGVFQAAMRAGRKEDANATVYIATGMVPDWLETKKAGLRRPSRQHDACTSLRSDSEQKVLKVLKEKNGISGSEVARIAGIPNSTTLDALNRLQEEGLVKKSGAGRGTKWNLDGVENVNIAGEVDLTKKSEMPFYVSIRGSRNFSEPVIPFRDRVANLYKPYPDWMRDIQRRSREQKFEEQLKQAQRKR